MSKVPLYETDLLGGFELALERVDLEEERIALVLHRHVDPPCHRMVTAVSIRRKTRFKEDRLIRS